MNRRNLIACGLAWLFAGLAQAAPPKVIITSPDNGEIGVDPAITEIRIEFDQPMHPGGRSIVGGGEAFPQITGELKWLNDRTFVMAVSLKPDHLYQFSVNSDTFKGFANMQGEPAEWYPVRFRTRSADAAAAGPELTLEQNKAALATLTRAIDDNYAYRDRLKIDWPKELAARRETFESARTANEFARLAAHLLRLAEDPHIWVDAGDVRIWTRSNSIPPNFNAQTLQRVVTGWKEHAGGVISGRFDAESEGGIGYVMFSQCSKEQAEDFDAAIEELKDTRGLILDARMNGGGDEMAARRVAGRFIEKAAVYSRDRLRGDGTWSGPFDRVVEPRDDAARYANPVVVLIGPKVMSSAESFVLMMRHGAGARLIGDATRGSSGRPMPHELGNGVSVYLPSWEDLLPDGSLLEGAGVQPDISVRTTLRELQKSDAVLDLALHTLRGK